MPAVHELFGVGVGQRRGAEPRAADQLGLHAARAECDEGAEHRILDDAGEQLDAACHRLDDDRQPDPLGCLAHLVLVA